MKEKILNYLRETLVEVKKVVWPDRRYVMVATTIILAIVVITSLFIIVVDYGLGLFFKVLLR